MRQKVFLVARARFDACWIDARIWDVSARGMMLTVASPAPEGSEVEIARGPVVYRGRVVWAAGDRCGVRIEETVDLDYLIGRTGRPSTERLSATKSEPSIDQAGDRSRLLLIETLRIARSSASRTRSSLSYHLSGTLHRVQASLER